MSVTDVADLFGSFEPIEQEPEIEDTRDDSPKTRRTGQGLPNFMKKHRFVRTDLATPYEDNKHESSQAPWDDVGIGKANLVTSVVKSTRGKAGELHRPVLDLDFDVAVLPSSTPGHHHLYIDKELTKEQLDKLVAVLNEIGILQDGIKNGYERHGELSLRLPWIDKNNDEDNRFDYAEYEKREKARKKIAELEQAKKDAMAQLAMLSK